jgi:hypothetical protein
LNGQSKQESRDDLMRFIDIQAVASISFIFVMKRASLDACLELQCMHTLDFFLQDGINEPLLLQCIESFKLLARYFNSISRATAARDILDA